MYAATMRKKTLEFCHKLLPYVCVVCVCVSENGVKFCSNKGRKKEKDEAYYDKKQKGHGEEAQAAQKANPRGE